MRDRSSAIRGEDRRKRDEGHDGPERRIAERRLPDGPPLVADAASLSDIDLVRASRRLTGGPDNAAAKLVRDEMDRRGLTS